MRIERLDLLSYGHLRNKTLDLSSPAAGLTIVVGPNEAGKSTTMRALTALLFGIDRRTVDDHRMGRESLRIGALISDGYGGAVEVVRRGLTRTPLVDGRGEPVDEAVLAALLGGLERGLFTALFCIDHDELHERSAQLLDPDAEIGRLVFGASLGANTLTGVLKELDARADALYRPRGSTQQVATTLSRARDLAKQAHAIRVRSREWEEAERDLERLGAEADSLRAESGRLHAQAGDLQRLISALPYLAKRSQLRDQRVELGRGGAVQTSEWAAAVARAQGLLHEAEAQTRRAVALRDDLQSRLQGAPIPESLLLAAARIDALLEGLGRFRKDRQDLPGLEGQLAASAGSLAALLERLGMTEATARRVSDVQLAAVEELAQARTALDERLASAMAELEALVEGIERQERLLEGLPDARDVEGLRRVLAVATPFVEQERSAGHEQAEADTLADDIRAGAARLGVRGDDFAALEALPTPAREALRRHREAQNDLRESVARLALRLSGLDDKARELAARRDELLADAAVPGADDVRVARVRRDDGWALVRAAWLDGVRDGEAVSRWSGGRALEEAFETSIGEADQRADARYDHARELANLEQIDVELASLAEQQRACAAERTDVDAVALRLADEWRALWTPTGVCPQSVDEGEAWLARLTDLQHVVAEHRRRRRTVDERVRQVELHRSAMVAAISALSLTPEAGSLALALEQAGDVVAAAQHAAEARRGARQVIDQGNAARPRREQAVTAARLAMGDWQRRWADAMSSVGLDTQTALAAGRQTLTLLREYRSELARAESLRARIGGLRDDIGQYAASVAALLGEVAPELAELDPERSLAELKPRLDEARKESRLRDERLAQLQAAEDQVATLDQSLREARGELLQLRLQAGFEADADLALEAERTAGCVALDQGIIEVEETLVAQGGGLTLAELLAAVAAAAAGPGELAARFDAVRAESLELDGRIEQTNQELGSARTRLESMDHGGMAAELEQDAEFEFAALAEHVSEYARVALAGVVLRRVVADYGQRNQGPILLLAGRNFAALTDGAFDHLLVDVDGDKQVLIAGRRNGEALRIGELSEGTVDQLYLALRLAGVEHHLDRVTANPPIVLDDLLVNFDDARASAALRLFAQLGRRTQVLLFTHHRHIGELAREVLAPDQVHVAELEPRDHETPVEAPERPPARAGARLALRGATGEGGTASAASAAAIVAVLESAPGPLGKSEILAVAGISDASWAGAVRGLVERGVIVQEGAKRGARYRLPE
jgi:uncharacterized protein YhaN